MPSVGGAHGLREEHGARASRREPLRIIDVRLHTNWASGACGKGTVILVVARESEYGLSG